MGGAGDGPRGRNGAAWRARDTALSPNHTRGRVRNTKVLGVNSGLRRPNTITIITTSTEQQLTIAVIKM